MMRLLTSPQIVPESCLNGHCSSHLLQGAFEEDQYGLFLPIPVMLFDDLEKSLAKLNARKE
jgi:hypothetical protein